MISSKIKDRYNRHKELAGQGICSIRVLCDEALEHEITWNEFVERLNEKVKLETDTIKALSRWDDATPVSHNNDCFPRSLEEAVDVLIEGLDEKNKEHLKAKTERELALYHHGWGTAIRNNFGLWKGNEELMESCGALEPDGASSVIIKRVWGKLREGE